ncbi:MAG: hypothetical protein VB674_09735 [Vicinamibacterales bacterium]
MVGVFLLLLDPRFRDHGLEVVRIAVTPCLDDVVTTVADEPHTLRHGRFLEQAGIATLNRLAPTPQ